MKMLHFALAALALLLPTSVAPVCAQELAGDEEIAAVAGGTVSVLVHDEAGKALAGLKVQISLRGATDQLWEGMTDRSGRFTQNLPAGRYSMKVLYDGTFVEREFSLAKGERKAFRLEIPAANDAP